MKNQSKKSQFDSNETVALHLNGHSKLEQAELITRLSINANLNRNETLIAMCCVSDLLYDAISQVQ